MFKKTFFPLSPFPLIKYSRHLIQRTCCSLEKLAAKNLPFGTGFQYFSTGNEKNHLVGYVYHENQDHGYL